MSSFFSRGKIRGSLREELPRHDTKRKCGILALQEANGRVYRRDLLCREVRRKRSEPFARKHFKNELQRGIPLDRVVSLLAKNPVRYAVAGYGVLSWVIGGVSKRIRI